MVHNLNDITWRDFFAPEHDEYGQESLPSGIFTNFGPSTAKNCDLVFLTIVRQKLGIGFWRCDQTVQNSNFFTWRDFCPLDKSIPKNFPPEILTNFGRPTTENYNSVILT